MAGELQLRIKFRYEKGNQIIDLFDPGDYYKEVTVAGDAAVSGRVLVGTSEETLSIPTDIGTVGYVLFLYDDADTDGYVEIGTTTTVYDIKISRDRPIAVLPWNGSTIYWKSTDVTTAAAVLYVIIEL